MRPFVTALLGCGLTLASAHFAGGAVSASVSPPTNQPTLNATRPRRTPSPTEREEAKAGQLRISGAFVDRIVLRPQNGAPLTLDAKQSVLNVPAGTYTLTEVRIKKGATEAVEYFLMAERTIAVKENAVTTLAVGGPLTNAVAVDRRGRSVMLTHRLIGVDGGTYRLTGPDQRKAPQFAIYQADRKIASGKFEFG